MLVVTQARATNTNGQWDDSQYAAWYDAQYSASSGDAQMGQSCCLTADGHPYDSSWTPNADGSVTLDGIGVIIPAYRILDGETVVFYDNTGAKIVRGGPNPTGHPIVWSNSNNLADENTTIYCFSPGALG